MKKGARGKGPAVANSRKATTQLTRFQKSPDGGPPGVQLLALADVEIDKFLFGDERLIALPEVLDTGAACPVCGNPAPCPHYDGDDVDDAEPIEDLSTTRYQRWLHDQLAAVADRYAALAQRLSTLAEASAADQDRALYVARTLMVLKHAEEWGDEVDRLRPFDKHAREVLAALPDAEGEADLDPFREDGPQQAGALLLLARAMRERTEVDTHDAAALAILTIIRRSLFYGIRRRLPREFLRAPMACAAAVAEVVSRARLDDLDDRAVARRLLTALGYSGARFFFDADRKATVRRSAKTD